MGWFSRKERPTMGKMQEVLQLREENFDTKQVGPRAVPIQVSIKETEAGSPAYNSVKQRALGVLKKKKMYQTQRDRTSNQSFNIDQAQFAATSVKEAKDTMTIMKATAKEIKKGLRKVDVDELEDLHDDMEELIIDSEEIQEALGRSYGVGEIDESELDGELEALEDDLLKDDLAEETPAYMKPREPTGGVALKDSSSLMNERQKTEEEEMAQLVS
eukprot:jgi/Galph1/554/GphlegSOOS_G5399.1